MKLIELQKTENHTVYILLEKEKTHNISSFHKHLYTDYRDKSINFKLFFGYAILTLLSGSFIALLFII